MSKCGLTESRSAYIFIAVASERSDTAHTNYLIAKGDFFPVRSDCNKQPPEPEFLCVAKPIQQRRCALSRLEESFRGVINLFLSEEV